MPIEPIVRAADRRPAIIPRQRGWGRRKVARVRRTEANTPTISRPNPWEPPGTIGSWFSEVFDRFRRKRRPHQREPRESSEAHIDIKI